MSDKERIKHLEERIQKLEDYIDYMAEQLWFTNTL